MREGRMLRIQCEFISHGRSHKDCIHKCAAKSNSRGEEMGVGAGREGSDERKLKEPLQQSLKFKETCLSGKFSYQVSL